MFKKNGRDAVFQNDEKPNSLDGLGFLEILQPLSNRGCIFTFNTSLILNSCVDYCPFSSPNRSN